ncbi:MAG TPA: DSD1 family PLP-dependent enzyme [Stellaceae bacterium]|jgi:D-serine deaminase-like pyridoxal phosphate-dependent protein|nr:DSD1 family PLP-dependent enzyme [Stellaceae bacterium]
MTTRPPAEIGMPLDDVDTPALIVDLDAFEGNLRRLAERVGSAAGVRLRPHAKTHKCPVIALKQVELGAVGVCVQKVGEAEAMVYGGVRDVLVTNEIVGKQKLRRLTALAHGTRIATCADDPSQVRALDEAAGEAGITLPIYVEVNMGGNRCGVEPGQAALDLARQIGDAKHLSFAGLQAYHGSAQHLRTWDERRQAIASATEKAATTRDLLSANGIACDQITGAGTGTFEFESGSGVYTELQCGSYIFMDADYGKNLDPDGRPTRAFEPSLFVWATVMSRPTEDRAIVDAGLKALAFDSGPPAVWDEPAATYERASDEHGRLAVTGATNRLRIGDKIKLVPGHCDPTVNLYDWYVGIRGGRVEAIWPITARGAVY